MSKGQVDQVDLVASSSRGVKIDQVDGSAQIIYYIHFIVNILFSRCPFEEVIIKCSDHDKGIGLKCKWLPLFWNAYTSSSNKYVKPRLSGSSSW